MGGNPPIAGSGRVESYPCQARRLAREGPIAVLVLTLVNGFVVAVTTYPAGFFCSVVVWVRGSFCSDSEDLAPELLWLLGQRPVRRDTLTTNRRLPTWSST